MAWQDAVFTVGSVLNGVALVPTVLGKSKPALSTSLLTGFTLAVYGLTFITLGLVFSAVAISVTAALWFALAVQKGRQRWTSRPSATT